MRTHVLYLTLIGLLVTVFMFYDVLPSKTMIDTQLPTPVVLYEEVVTETAPARTVVTLDFSRQGLREVPPEFFERTDVQKLDLSYNNLSGALPAEVRHFQELIILHLSDNDFTGVPAEIGQLSKLEVLDLSNNPITGLPHELANLNNLKILDLRGTEYATYDLDIISDGLPHDVKILTDD